MAELFTLGRAKLSLDLVLSIGQAAGLAWDV
jgi:hypothetical protein